MTRVHLEISNKRDWLWVEFPLLLKLISRVKFQLVDATALKPAQEQLVGDSRWEFLAVILIMDQQPQ